MLEAVRDEAPEAVVVAVCSSEVYGPPASLPVDARTRRCARRTPTRSRRRRATCSRGFYADAHGLRVIRARAFNHAGPGQEPTYAIASFARQIAGALEAASDPCGSSPAAPTRAATTPTCATSSRAYRLLAARGEPGVYNVCSGVSRSARELVAALAEVAGRAVEHDGRPGAACAPTR